MTDHFCTCTDLTCPRNPHSEGAARHGCDPCIRHYLRRGEVPAGFAAYVREHTGS